MWSVVHRSRGGRTLAALVAALFCLLPTFLIAQAQPSAPFCTAGQMRGSQTAMLVNGTIQGGVGVTNFSSTTCLLQGAPAIQPFFDTMQNIPVTNLAASTPAPTIVLPPGAAASAPFLWVNYCGPAISGGINFITVLPHGGGNVSNMVGVPAAAPPACTASGSPSTITDQPFQPVSQPVIHDEQYFPATGFRIDDPVIWDYFNRRGGINTFGFPVSRTFLFQGFIVQFFQRRIVQLAPNGQARLLNVLDPGLLPYTSFNFATFPAFDPALVASAPPATDAAGTLAFVQAHAPNSFAGFPVNFYQTFLNTVPASVVFPNGGGNPVLLPGFDLEMWGIPTSQPMQDPNNHNFVYLRWQRGIMHFSASCNCTQGILLADYLKSILTGQNLPADLAQESQNSPFSHQYDPNALNWVHNPSTLPDTSMINAFTPG
jgi:hypothetical protein